MAVLATYPHPQPAVDDAWAHARRCKHACYVHERLGWWAINTLQPSRFQAHYRVDTDGRLWWYNPPAMPAGKVDDTPKELTYEEIR